MAGISMAGACQERWKSGFVGPREIARARNMALEARMKEVRGDRLCAATRDLGRKIVPSVRGLPGIARLMHKQHGRPTQLSSRRMASRRLSRQSKSFR